MRIMENGLASFDGDTVIPMVTGDRIVIQKASVSSRNTETEPCEFCRGAAAENDDH